MWAYRLCAPGRFERVEVPAPRESDLAEGQVLLRALAGGICGSDLPTFRGAVFPHPRDQSGYSGLAPGLPMHEIVGEIVASRHSALRPGDRVVGWASGFDALAEFVVSDGNGLIDCDPGLPATTAVAIQPLACVLFAVEQLGDLAGVRAAVLGQGPIGLLFSHVLSRRGAHVVGVDRVDRSADAAVFGMTETATTSADRWAAALTDAERPHLVVEAIGHQVGTLRSCVEAVAFGGQIFCFGVPDDPVYPLEMRTFFRKNLTLRGGWTMDRRRVLRAAAGHLAAHEAIRDAYVSHVFTADDAQNAFEAALAPKPGQFKIVLDMSC